MADEVQIPITVKDEASKPVKKIADNVEDLTDKPHEVKLDASKAEQTAKQLQSDIHDILEEGKKPVELDTSKAKRGLDDVSKSAGSSKSALANMIGNSAQDLGDLGGIAGSTGVAIGQMAEYMADAALEGEALTTVVANFAKVAVPIAALTVAFQFLQAQAEKAKEEIGNVVDQSGQGVGSVEAFGAAMDASARNAFDLSNNLAAVKDVLGLEDWDNTRKAVDAFNQVLEKSPVAAANLLTQLEQGFPGLKLTAEQLDTMANKLVDVVQAQAAGTDAQKEFNQATKDATTLLEHGVAIRRVAGQSWDDYTAKLREAAVHYEVLDGAVTAAQDAQSKQAAAAVAGLDAQNKAAQQFVAEQEAAFKALAQGLATVNTALVSTGTAVTGAKAAWGFVTDLDNQTRDSLVAVEEGLDNLTEGFKKNGRALDIHTKAGRTNIKNAETLRKSYGEAFAQTLQDTNGDFQAATLRVLGLTQEFDKQAKAAGLSEKQIAEYHHELGLTPEQVETTIKLTKDDEARQKLGLLQGVISKLEGPQLVEFNALVNAGDYQGALALLQSLKFDPKTGKFYKAEVEASVTGADGAKGQLNGVATNDGKGYTAEITTKEKGLAEIQAAYDNLRNKTVFIDFEGKVHVGGAMAGANVPPGGGVYRVGEAGPETVILPGGAHVLTAGRTMQTDAHSAGGNTTIINVTVNVPAAANPAEVGGHIVKAITAFERRSGKGWRAA